MGNMNIWLKTLNSFRTFKIEIINFKIYAVNDLTKTLAIVPFTGRSNLPDCPFNKDVDVTLYTLLFPFTDSYYIFYRYIKMYLQLHTFTSSPS
jgi:hypothetical protein